MSGPEVTVVIPTRDRPRALGRCLEALQRQRNCPPFEVLVVDDGSVDGNGFRRSMEAYPTARRVRLDGRGPSAARNAGVRQGRGKVFCFLDDDCEPVADWLARINSAIRAGADVVGGSTLNGRPRDRLASASEVVARCLADGRPGGALAPFTRSNNVACRREVLVTVPFDERYEVPGGEDRQWCAELTAAGYGLSVEPDAVVLHHPELTLAGFWRQQVRYGRGAYRFRAAQGRPFAFERPSFYSRLIAGAFGEGAAVGLLVCLAQLATLAGFLREALRVRGRAGA